MGYSSEQATDQTINLVEAGIARPPKTALLLACASHFALLRNPVSTVPMYADEPGLLVFGVSLTSVSLSKNKFFDRLKQPFLRLLFLSKNAVKITLFFHRAVEKICLFFSVNYVTI